MLWKTIHARILDFLKEGIHPGMLNPVFGLPVPKDVPKHRGPSPNERYWLDWFREFSEINNSMERLTHSLVYLSSYPKSKAFHFHRLSEADWLRYHIEAYLNEVYILHERLTRFLRKIEKVGIAARDKSALNSVNKLKAVVTASLKNVVRARGGHVHEQRFDDTELANLGSLVLITKSSELRPLRTLRQLQYLKALQKWRRQLLANNKETQKLCEYVFEEANTILIRHEPPGISRN